MENIFDRKLFDISRVRTYPQANAQPEAKGYAQGGNTGIQVRNPGWVNPYQPSGSVVDAQPNIDLTKQPTTGIPSLLAGEGPPVSDTNPALDSAIGKMKVGVGALRSHANDAIDYLGRDKTAEEWMRMFNQEGDEIGRRAVQLVQREGKPLSNVNVNRMIDKLTNNRRRTNLDASTLDEPAKTGIEQFLEDEKTPAKGGEDGGLGYGQRPDESLDDFAKRIGIDLGGKAYSNWDYIADMSAGLLVNSNKDGTFFGALGPAAEKVNANKSTAEAAQKGLRNKLAIAKWKNDEDWAKDLLKLNSAERLAKLKDSKFELKGDKITSDDGRGNKTTLQLITGDWTKAPADMILWRGGRPFYKSTSTNDAVMLKQTFDNKESFNTKISDYVKTDNMQSMLDQFALGTSYGGEMISRLRDSDDQNDLLKDFREGKSDMGQRLADLMADKDADPDDIVKLVGSLRDSDAAEGALKRSFLSGLYSQVLPSEKAELAQVIGKAARDAGGKDIENDPWESYMPMDYINTSTAEIMGNAKWGLEAGNPAKWNPKQTEGDLANYISGWDTLTGEDDSNEILNTRLFNISEYTPNHSLYGTKGGQHPFKGSMANDSQWEMLPPEDKKKFFNDGSALSAMLQRDHGYTQARADEDVMSSFIDSNSIRGGADNFIVWNDYESSYTKPKKWFVEPDGYYDAKGKHHTIAELRKDKITWNGISGEWYRFSDVDSDYPRRNPQMNAMKQQGLTWPKVKTIDLR